MTQKETVPIVTFSYFGILELPKLYEHALLSVSKRDPEMFENMCKSYTVISHIHNKNHVSVYIHDILYSDMMYVPNSAYLGLKELYHSYCKRYGYETVSKIIVQDQFVIKKKIEDILNFIMNDMYKVDELEVHFKVPGRMQPPSSIPEIIYSILKSKFMITHEKLADEIEEIDVDPNLRAIQIKKRSD